MIKLITHYATDDPKFYSDYIDVEIVIHDKVVFTAGDWYHDKGDILAKGFLEGYKHAMDIMELEVERVNVADREI